MAALTEGCTKRVLSNPFWLTNFGVNLMKLASRGSSALPHAHSKQDEFIYILAGHPTLHNDAGMTRLAPGMCAAFKVGTGDAHWLAKETDTEVPYLKVGDRTASDDVQ